MRFSLLSKFKPKSEFSRNVLTLITGTTIAQAIPIAISPILTRIYTPEDFGIFGLYISITVMIGVFVTGKYELAIMLPQEEEEAANILVLSILITIFMSLLTFLFIYIWHADIMNLFSNKELSDYLYFMPLTILFIGSYQAFNYWSNRQKNYKLMSQSIIVKAISNATGNISFGFLNYSFAGLIFTNIITSLIALCYIVLKNIASIHKHNITYEKILSLIVKYKQFPTHTAPQNFIYQLTLQLPILIITIMFSLPILGFFILANRILLTPLSILGNSLGQVFYQKGTSLYTDNKNELYYSIRSMFIKLLMLSSIVGMTIIYFLPDLFSILFGNRWIQGGAIAQHLLIYLIYRFALEPFTRIYLISKNNHFYFKWEMSKFLTFIIFFSFFYFLKIDSIKIFFISFAIINLIFDIILSAPILYRKSFLWR